MSSWSNWETWTPPIVMLVILLFTGAISQYAVNSWYRDMNKSDLTPPPWVFIAAWTILFILITICWVRANLIVNDPTVFQQANWAFSLNIILIFLWTIFFFMNRNMYTGLLINLLLIGVAVWLLVILGYDPVIATFISIYLAWLIFAALLNWFILKNNQIDSNGRLDLSPEVD